MAKKRGYLFDNRDNLEKAQKNIGEKKAQFEKMREKAKEDYEDIGGDTTEYVKKLNEKILKCEEVLGGLNDDIAKINEDIDKITKKRNSLGALKSFKNSQEKTTNEIGKSLLGGYGVDSIDQIKDLKDTVISSTQKAKLAFELASLLKLQQYRESDERIDLFYQLEAKGYEFNNMDKDQLDTIKKFKEGMLRQIRFKQKELYRKMFKSGDKKIPKLNKEIILAVGDGGGTSGLGGVPNFGRILFDYNVDDAMNKKNPEEKKEVFKTNNRYILRPEGNKNMLLSVTGTGLDRYGGKISIKIGDHDLLGEYKKKDDGSVGIVYSNADQINSISGVTVNSKTNEISINSDQYGSHPLISVNVESKNFDEVNFNVSHTGIESKLKTAPVVPKAGIITDAFKNGNYELSEDAKSEIAKIAKLIEYNYMNSTGENYKGEIELSSSVDTSKITGNKTVTDLEKGNKELFKKLEKKFSKKIFEKLKNDIVNKSLDSESNLEGQPGQMALAQNRALVMLLELADQLRGVSLEKYVNIEIGTISETDKRMSSIKIIN